jgi:hypothetical protein
MTIQIEEIEPEAEYRFRIINTRSGYEDKSYTIKSALRIANEMMAEEIRHAQFPENKS